MLPARRNVIRLTKPCQQADQGVLGGIARCTIGGSDHRDVNGRIATRKPTDIGGWPAQAALEDRAVGINNIVVGQIIPAENVGLVGEQCTHQINTARHRRVSGNLMNDHAARIAAVEAGSLHAATPIAATDQHRTRGKGLFAREDWAARQTSG